MNALQEGLKRAAKKEQPAPPPKKGGKQNGSRTGTVLIGAHLDPSVRQRLLAIRAKHPERTTQALLIEALNLLFREYGQPTIR
jgi:antitoxin-like ribbon-helix-helix protein